MYVTIYYTCHLCQRGEQKAFVRYRKPGEDIRVYMDEIRRTVEDAHSLSSPGCQCHKVDLKIPISANGSIGTN